MHRLVEVSMHALQAGAFILTDTEMAKAAVAPMARRTLGTKVRSVLEWAREPVSGDLTRTSLGMERAWTEMTFSSERPAPIVLIGSAPTAPQEWLGSAQVRLDRNVGGAGLASVAVHALLCVAHRWQINSDTESFGLPAIQSMGRSYLSFSAGMMERNYQGFERVKTITYWEVLNLKGLRVYHDSPFVRFPMKMRCEQH